MNPHGSQPIVNQLLVFVLEEQKYALSINSVERLIRAVEIVPLPGAPEIVLGVIDLRGRIIPVINVRKRFGLAERTIDPGDQIVIARSSKRSVGLVVDSVAGVIEPPGEDIISTEDILPGVRYVAGVVRIKDGIVLIHDLDAFLSLDEEERLDEAMRPIGVAGRAPGQEAGHR